jgi:hypothetical protein
MRGLIFVDHKLPVSMAVRKPATEAAQNPATGLVGGVGWSWASALARALPTKLARAKALRPVRADLAGATDQVCLAFRARVRAARLRGLSCRMAFIHFDRDLELHDEKLLQYQRSLRMTVRYKLCSLSADKGSLSGALRLELGTLRYLHVYLCVSPQSTFALCFSHGSCSGMVNQR